MADIDPTNGFPIPEDNQAIQYRRAEKGWRHRDAERTWTQYIWGLLVTSQSIMLAIFAIIATRPEKTVSRCQLVVVVVATVVELGLFLWRSCVRRRIDRLWAEHFEGIVDACERKRGYDNDRYDKETKDAERDWSLTVHYFDWVGFVLFAITAGILLYAVWFSSSPAVN